MIYDENNSKFTGTVDVTANVIIPVATSVHSVKTSDYFEFEQNAKIAVQLWSSDLSASTDWALEVSMDGTNWAAALDSSGTAITGALVASTAYVNTFEGINKMRCRIKFTVVAQTGNVSYIFRNHA
ncbi:hypothetical protein [uncultured Mediterranean phage]|nr:hypothetical protein [uncultured Mediterranean phage]